MEPEVWLPYHNYQVSNFGRVKSGRGKVSYGWDRNGYKSFTTNQSKQYVHRAVAMLFCEGESKGLVVDHIDEDKTNNHFSNLRWVTLSENSKGPSKRPIKIADEVIIKMMAYRCMGWNNTEIARALDVDRRNVSKILLGRTNSKLTGIEYDRDEP